MTTTKFTTCAEIEAEIIRLQKSTLELLEIKCRRHLAQIEQSVKERAISKPHDVLVCKNIWRQYEAVNMMVRQAEVAHWVSELECMDNLATELHSQTL